MKYTVIGLVYVGNGHYVTYFEYVDADSPQEACKIADDEHGEPHYVLEGEVKHL